MTGADLAKTRPYSVLSFSASLSAALWAVSGAVSFDFVFFAYTPGPAFIFLPLLVLSSLLDLLQRSHFNSCYFLGQTVIPTLLGSLARDPVHCLWFHCTVLRPC